MDDSDGDKAKFYFGNSTQFIKYDGTNLTIEGGLSVDEIHIGGEDTSSAHIDTSGNLHLGAASGNFSTAPARISSAGAAVFQSGRADGRRRGW